jgi:hypothetical protein
MLQVRSDSSLGDDLLKVALDPELRARVYEHLREYCHQCRNRLNSLKLGIYLAKKQCPPASVGTWEAIDRQYHELEASVEQVQFLCRTVSLSRVTIGIDLLIDDRIKGWARVMAARGKSIEVVPPATRALASFDVDGIGRALDSIVEWRAAARTASNLARLAWRVDDGWARLSWEEPNLPPGEPAPEEPPSWTLPMLARIIQAHGGNYRITTNPEWKIELAWPSQPPAP